MGTGIPIPVIGTTVPRGEDPIMAIMATITTATTTTAMAITGPENPAMGDIPTIIAVATDTGARPPRPLKLNRSRAIVERFLFLAIRNSRRFGFARIPDRK